MAETEGMNRRDFLKGIGAGAIGGGLIATGAFYGTGTGIVSDVGTGRAGVAAIEASEGYLLIDSLKCSSCQSCMLACSLVHEGVENINLSRIQILFNSFGQFPDDINMEHCRQCVYPACLFACPTGALHADEETGVRVLDADLCIGCQRCVEACPFSPSRSIWNFEDGNAQKCDLCADTPYWNTLGGPDGHQACVEICPMRAIKFSAEIPAQIGDLGYDVNLRTPNCCNVLGLSAYAKTGF